MSRRAFHCIPLLAAALLPLAVAAAESERETVVLLHGLARTHRSMRYLERRLQSAGFKVINLRYPSRKHPFAQLAGRVEASLKAHRFSRREPLHFVTHSMGGILVRWLIDRGRIPNAGRVVMLSPPNQGSEVVDKLKGNPVFEFIMGPAGEQMGTGPDSVPADLGPVDFELGVIVGNRSWNPLFSLWIPGEDDGRVSTRSARVEGMKDFLVVPAGHSFILQNRTAARQAIHFLRHGKFKP